MFLTVENKVLFNFGCILAQSIAVYNVKQTPGEAGSETYRAGGAFFEGAFLLERGEVKRV